MSYHGVLSKRSLILIQLSRGPSNKLHLARALGYKESIGVAREVNQLIEDGKITEDSSFRCPHCSKEIKDIPLTKAEKMLRLTTTGKTECNQAREELRELLGDAL